MEQQAMKRICLKEITVYAIMTPKGFGPREIKEYFMDENLAKTMVQINMSLKDHEIVPVNLYVDSNGNLFDLQQKKSPYDDTLKEQISKIESIKEKLSETEVDFINNYPWKF